ncbi:MAG TPA: SDR family oxidoreductase [Phycisphaerales bacterium]|mgnify:CR=1 FL=1|nr:SDR family oxidoreductase [Phycisphaerales bacterium]HMP37706.1 SDR family oxidoreductase [Phycisphaerales bacterium]
MQFRDKVAVITGGASGIGRSLTRMLGELGIRAVGVVDMSESVEPAVADVNRELGREFAFSFRGDVTDPAFRRGVFADLKSRFGAVHICVPGAGIVRDGIAVKVDKATGEAKLYDQSLFEKTVAINLIAPVYWAIEAIASVAEERFRRGLGQWQPTEEVQGGIVFIGSISSAGNKGQVSYASTKAGLEGAQSTLAKEAIYHGMRCAIIHPGFTDTPMVRAMDPRIIEQHVLPNTQLRRLLQPEEIADAICFLLRNSAVSGALWADAGWHPSA